MNKVYSLFFPPIPPQGAMEFTEKGKPVVYKRRWAMLALLASHYFFWNWSDARQVILTSEYALYFDTTNNFDPESGEFGVDFLKISSAAYYIMLYPIFGFLVDKYGIRLMLLGMLLQSIGVWWWYLSFEAYFSVVVARMLTAAGGVMNASCMLKLINSWFPATERPGAVAVGVLAANLGAGASVVIGPFFPRR